MRRIALLTLALAAGCGGPTEVIGTDGQLIADSCDARSQRGLVGRPLSDRAALAAAAPKVRFIEHNSAVTQDNQPDRLNVVFDADGVVTRVYCG